ncbi:K homology domain-containing protein [Tanacetum coccineum]
MLIKESIKACTYYYLEGWILGHIILVDCPIIVNDNLLELKILDEDLVNSIPAVGERLVEDSGELHLKGKPDKQTNLRSKDLLSFCSNGGVEVGIQLLVGVLIGKAGGTIRTLQNSSGARIQITRDAEADPHSANNQGTKCDTETSPNANCTISLRT